jgi:cytochrome P450
MLRRFFMVRPINPAAARAPGPRGTLLLGNFAAFRRDPIGFLSQATSQHGDIVRLRFGPITAHLVNHPDYVRHVLEERYQNYDKRTRSVSKIRATCGASLLTEEGPLWLRHRRLIQPALLRQAVQRYVPSVTAATTSMLGDWRAAAHAGRPLNIVSEMLRLTMTIAVRVLFGSDVSNDTPAIEGALTEILADTWRRMESAFDPAALSKAFHRRSFKRAVRRIDNVVYRIIDARRRASSQPEDLLAALVAARDAEADDHLTDRELRDATITMLLAGHETTAHALAWAMSLIYRSPSVEERLAEEADRVLQYGLREEDGRDGLDYTARTFAEAIRLYPSIWIMERRVVAADQMGGYAIPAGSMLLISPYVLHRHPRYWPDAEDFDPDRFTPARAAERPRHAYIPFGAGPHQCIGRFLAPLVARYVIAMVVRSFRLAPVSATGPAPVPGITLRQSGGLWMLPSERTAGRIPGGRGLPGERGARASETAAEPGTAS